MADGRNISFGVHFDGPEAQNPAGAWLSRAFQHGIHPGDQLMRIERFDDVIVSAEAKAGQLVHILRKRGDHDDGRFPFPPDAVQHLDAIEFRQADVEENQIRPQHGEMGQRRFSIAGSDGSVSFANEIGVQNLNDIRVVFDDQNKPFVHAEPANLFIYRLWWWRDAKRMRNVGQEPLSSNKANAHRFPCSLVSFSAMP
ncbi:hypothetical protein D3C78_1300750 [compost metagenome]